MSDEILILNEDESANVSWQNVVNLMDSKGKIVGVLLAIVPIRTDNESLDYYITKVFYSNGYCHTAFGFVLGYKEEMGEERFAKAMALESILATIIGLAPIVMGPEFYDLGLDKETTEYLNASDKAVYFLFRSPESARTPNFLTLPGYSALMNCVEILKNEDEKIVMIGAQDE